MKRARYVPLRQLTDGRISRPMGDERIKRQRYRANKRRDSPNVQSVCQIYPLFTPDKIRVRLKDSISFTVSTTLADDYYEFALNGMYDPYLGVGGGQPYGFDQWGALYNNYRVLAGGITATFYNNGSTQPIRLTIVPNPKDDTNLRLFQDPQQLPLSKTGIASGTSHGKAIVTVSNYVSMNKLVGRQAAVDDDFKGSLTTNPDAQGLAKWYVTLQSESHTANFTGTLYVDIMYYAEFTGRKRQADS
uniref:hypothetical protein n=1 Tax=Limnohabitans sp. TaxID=1907725 RepID=UPI0040483EE1